MPAGGRGWITGGIVLRLLLGALLIGAAGRTALPRFTLFLGVVVTAAALIAPLFGYRRLQAFVAWWAGCSPALLRLWAAVALVLGALLVYAAVAPPSGPTVTPMLRAAGTLDLLPDDRGPERVALRATPATRLRA